MVLNALDLEQGAVRQEPLFLILKYGNRSDVTADLIDETELDVYLYKHRHFIPFQLVFIQGKCQRLLFVY